MALRSRRASAWLAIALAGLALVGCHGARNPEKGPAPLESGRPPVPQVPPEWPYPLDAPPAEGSRGMVATDAPLATAVGAEILRRGGNAADAAVATAFALAVVLPRAGNLGGGGFIVAHVMGKDYALDFREAAPAAARPDMYLDGSGEPGEGSVTGHLAAGVPGSVAGLWAFHRRLGTKKWADLLAPAIRLAEEGFPVDADLARSVSKAAERLARFPGSADLFLPEGRPLREGDRWRNPDLARVLRRIAERGPDGFYRGETADLIAREMEAGAGILTREDLARYTPIWREPIEFAYRGHRVVSMPPPSSGGILLVLIARQLEAYDLGRLGWHTAEAIHLEAEAMRRAFAVRNRLLGDPDFTSIPRARLLSPDFASALRSTISPTRATPSAEVSGEGDGGAGGKHTTHFSVADGRGNAVALTTTLNLSYGSAVAVRGGGFLLNNEMDDFTAKPGASNAFGLVQGEANAIAPGKRPLSSMSPTIVFDRGGEVLLVTGASGGPKIITAVFQVLSNRLDYGLGVSASQASPRIHHQHLPDEIFLERGGFDAAQIKALERMGHKVTILKVGEGALSATLERRAGRWQGVSDPRTHGLAKGN